MSAGLGLAELVAARAEAAGDVEPVALGDRTEFRRSGRTFAVLLGDALEVDLGRAVAGAALRTPDVAPSDRGVDWVVFRPATLDRFASDRAGAWFDAAHRRAAAPGTSA
jgi:hypothetical protein